MSNSAKNNYKRYRLHQKIKNHFAYNALEQTVSIPHNCSVLSLPINVLQALVDLKKLNYQLQIIID